MACIKTQEKNNNYLKLILMSYGIFVWNFANASDYFFIYFILLAVLLYQQ
jgi:hypothetical protein